MNVDDSQVDLARTMHRIMQLIHRRRIAGETVLTQVGLLLDAFISRHRGELTFENFPLPQGSDAALNSYELYADERTGLTLWLQAIRAGVDSVVHDHGTWAVIVAIAGQETNRIYSRLDDQRIADRATLSLPHEVTVSPGRPLVLEQGLFHSIHTADEPTLQLHLYGCNPDQVEGRMIVEADSGRLVYLGAETPRSGG